MTARGPAPERLINAYLHDLERALFHLEADVRQDVVDSVREHIDTALEERGRAPTDGDIEDVLRQLGPVEHIAHNADDGSPAPHADARSRDRMADRRGAIAPQYLLAALVIGMAITGALAIVRVPAFFSPEGGDPVTVAQLAFVFIVFAVAAQIVRSGSSASSA